MLSRISFKIDTTGLKEGDLSLQALGNALDKLRRKKHSLEMPDFRKNAIRKLKNVAYALAVNVASNAYVNTPVGDSDKIASSKEYFKMYQMRSYKYGIDITPGFHAGAYSYAETRIPKFDKEIKSFDQMLSKLKLDFESNFELGDVFYVGAKGPAYALFEKGYIDSAPDGVVKPTLQSIMSSYKADITAAYARRAR